ncbi:hypothetical protein YTPLAS18_37610 [Nitrospira sp.]|nr:hypothetical protein YTPLAS18_37610 [Nitrospira sp.]
MLVVRKLRLFDIDAEHGFSGRGEVGNLLANKAVEGFGAIGRRGSMRRHHAIDYATVVSIGKWAFCGGSL